MNRQPLVLLVGHCMPDSFGLTRVVRQAAPGADVRRVNSDKALHKRLDEAALLLINRELDGRFSFAEGVPLIRHLRDEGVSIPIMLISNFPDAQDAAVSAGAIRGFGKRDLRDPATVELLQSTLAASSAGA